LWAGQSWLAPVFSRRFPGATTRASSEGAG
jgi:hypothetical protein